MMLNKIERKTFIIINVLKILMDKEDNGNN